MIRRGGSLVAWTFTVIAPAPAIRLLPSVTLDLSRIFQRDGKHEAMSKPWKGDVPLSKVPGRTWKNRQELKRAIAPNPA
jgi:hypothetical protein